MIKSIRFLLILLIFSCFKLAGKTRSMYIDLKIQVLNSKQEPLSNQMVMVVLGHRLPPDTLYTDGNGYFNYTYKHANPYCRGIKSVLDRRKKIRINFIINSKNSSVKVKHKRFDYYSGEKARKIVEKTVQL